MLPREIFQYLRETSLPNCSEEHRKVLSCTRFCYKAKEQNMLSQGEIYVSLSIPSQACSLGQMEELGFAMEQILA